jgi:hypothetical protein
MARHAAPFRCRQTIVPTVRRRTRGGVLPFGRHASTSGSSATHCASVKAIGRSRHGAAGDNALGPHRTL